MQQSEPKKLKVLSLNFYIMGHVTYQDILEKTFAEQIPEVEFNSLHLTDYFKTDLLGRTLYWLLSKQLPGAKKADYDFHRFRTEIANSFFGRRCLEQHLKKYQPDVIHVHNQAIALLSIPLFKKLPGVISLDYTAALLAQEHPFPAAITYRPIVEFERRCFRAADRIITWSHRARKSVIEDYGISPEKVTNVQFGMVLELFSGMNRSLAPLTKKPRLLFVGNDFTRKGGEDVLAVFLESLVDRCELDMVSNAAVKLPAMPNLRIHRNLRPLSPELLHLYEMADIFVMPTHEDVYGITFVEAMAAGLPCIGTKVMAVPELVQDGVNGLTITPGDRAALRQALLQLIDNPALRLSMGVMGRKIAENKFDAIANTKQIATIFQNCAGSNSQLK